MTIKTSNLETFRKLLTEFAETADDVIESAINVATDIHTHHPQPMAECYLAAHIATMVAKRDNADAVATLRAERIGPLETEYQRLPDSIKATRISYLQSTRYGRIYMQLVARFPTMRAAPLVST